MIFSEYLEGSSNDKALELYNPSGTSISLAPCSIEVYNNGAVTPSTSLLLTGSLASNDVFVVASASESASILAQADATSSICQFNGNDAVALVKTDP
ncbi:MAG: lamin tail domain-containing protein [Bacteroidetes bacterium]|nr:lamin tail domain-containing protein [Bacteroidota bacterium]